MTPWTAACQVPCPSLSPRVSPNSCPLIESMISSNISFSVAHFSSCSQSFPASGSLPMSWLFEARGQSIGASASASVLPGLFRAYFLWDWLVLSPCCPRDSRVFSSNSAESINSSAHSLFYGPVTHPYTTTGKTIAWTIRTFAVKWCPCFLIHSKFVIAFLPRSKHLLVSDTWWFFRYVYL